MGGESEPHIQFPTHQRAQSCPQPFIHTLFPARVGSNPISHKAGFNVSRRKNTCWQLNELSATQTSRWNLEQSIKRVRIVVSAVFRNEVSLERKEIWQGKENKATAPAQFLETNSRISLNRENLLLECSPGRFRCYRVIAHKTQPSSSAFQVHSFLKKMKYHLV